MYQPVLTVLMLLTIALVPLRIHAADGAELKTSIWERYLGQATYSYTNKAVALSINSLRVSGSISPPYKSKKENIGSFICEVKTTGVAGECIEFSELHPDIGKLIEITSTIMKNDDTLIAAVKNEKEKYFLIDIDNGGKISVAKRFETDFAVTKMVSDKKGSYIVFGNKIGKPVGIKTDALGKEVWRKSFDRGRDDMVTDCLAMDDGGFMLVESSGKTHQFYMGESDLFVVRYDTRGDKVAERYLPGRNGRITKGKDGKILLVYDKSATAEQDIWVQAYDRGLNPVWAQKVASAKLGFESFKVAALANGNYVVAGSVNGKPLVTYISSSGSKKWEYFSTSKEFHTGVDLIAQGNDCYLVSSIITLNAEKALINKIKVHKFQPE